MSGKEFLSLVHPARALEIFASFEPVAARRVPILAAVGRVLAEDVCAPGDFPPFGRATMAGYAVRAQYVHAAAESAPAVLRLVGEVIMGRAPDVAVGPGEAVAVPTGGVLPEGADAVVMVEHTAQAQGFVQVFRPVGRGANVVLPGDDYRAGEPVALAGRRVAPGLLGVLAGLGTSEVSVRGPVRVGVVPTGDEIVPFQDSPRLGQVRDVNGPALAAAAQALPGVEAVRVDPVPDRRQALEEVISSLLEGTDVVLLSGGSSVGVRDLTAAVLESLGGEILFHGVAVKPGRPLICARVRGKPVLGMPGHPVSSSVAFSLLVRPLLRHLAGEKLQLVGRRAEDWLGPDLWPERCRARLGRRVASVAGRDEFVRVRIEGAPLVAWPLPRDSALLRSLAEADGLVRVPAGTEGLEAGTEVEVLLHGV